MLLSDVLELTVGTSGVEMSDEKMNFQKMGIRKHFVYLLVPEKHERKWKQLFQMQQLWSYQRSKECLQQLSSAS